MKIKILHKEPLGKDEKKIKDFFKCLGYKHTDTGSNVLSGEKYLVFENIGGCFGKCEK